MSMGLLMQLPDESVSWAWKIRCECGELLPLDTMTECSECGAHYELRLEQTAPPIEAGENDD